MNDPWIENNLNLILKNKFKDYYEYLQSDSNDFKTLGLYDSENLSKCAIIVGNSKEWREEYNSIIERINVPHKTFTVNKTAFSLISDYIVTLHPELFHNNYYVNSAKLIYHTNSVKQLLALCTTETSTEYDYIVNMTNFSGSSSGQALMVAIGMGFTNFVLCGCPMEDKDYVTSQRFWDRIKYSDFNINIKSCSGHTKKIFGYPDFLLNSKNNIIDLKMPSMDEHFLYTHDDCDYIISWNEKMERWWAEPCFEDSISPDWVEYFDISPAIVTLKFLRNELKRID